MDERELNSCMVKENVWRCPISTCSSILSRKQTLQSHIANIHSITAGKSVKRYKLYESNEFLPVPKSTMRRQSLLKTKTNWKETQDQDMSFSQEKQGSSSCLMEKEVFNTLRISDNIIYSENYTDDMELDDNNEDLEENEEELCTYSEDENDLQCCKNTKDNNQTEEQDDPPLYVIPPSSEALTSKLTRSEHSLVVSAYSARHNLSDTGIKDLITLLQLHLPENNIGETKLPSLKEKCGFNKDSLTFHLYCELCKKLYSNESDACKTPGCDGVKTNSQCCKYFVTSDLKIQIKEVLERKGMWQAIETSRTLFTSDTINDVRSGMGYKELQKPGGFLYHTKNITLSMFTDGVPLFKSSAISLWPVYLLINEIPPKERFSRKNMLLWGLWQGNGKPKMNMFLYPLVLDLWELWTKGILVTVDEIQHPVKAMLIIATMDLQARAYVTNMTQHNGEYSCLYCEEPGVVVASGKGRCRSFSVREEPAKLRTNEEFEKDAKYAQQNGTRFKGIMGESVLSYLPYFSMTEHIVIDYMHGILLGITKKFLHLWFDSEYKDCPFFIGQHMSEIDKILKSIKPPYIIHRMPRILSNTFQHWKASELRNWLLFYSLPCLKEYLPAVYLNHFSCLVEATYTLLSEGITPTELQRADRLLVFFVAQINFIYGENYLSLNMHNLTHLVHFVKMWGPLWAWSCFSFESFNGEIKHGIHGTGNVCRQVFWSVQAQKNILGSSSEMQGSVKEYLDNLLDGGNKKKSGKGAYQCTVIKPQDFNGPISNNVRTQLKQMVNFENDTDFMKASKIIRNGFVMYCSSSSKVKKQNSFTIALEKERSTGEFAIEIEMYLLHKQSDHVFAIGKYLSSKGSILEKRIPHLNTIEYSNQLCVARAEELRQPLFIISSNNKVFGAFMPNHFERD